MGDFGRRVILAKSRSKISKSGERLLIISIIVIIYMVFERSLIGVLNLQGGNNAQFVSTNTFVEYTVGLYPQFYVNDNNVFLSTNEGLYLYDANGNLSWQFPYNMDNILFRGSHNFVGAAETMGNSLYIASEDGIIYTKNFDYPILTFSINSIGFCAVILEYNDSYAIYVYDNNGNVLMETVFQDENIFPIAIDISDDGRIVAISFLNINNVNIQSNILFFYVYDIESLGYIDGMFGASATQEGQIIGTLNFMFNNQLVAVSSNQIVGISTSIENLLNVVWHVEFETSVSHVVFVNDRTIAIAYENGRIEFYSHFGSLIGTHDIGSPIRYINANYDNIIVGTGYLNRTFYGIDTRGRVLWQLTAFQDVNQVIFLNDINKILFATNVNAQILERIKY